MKIGLLISFIITAVVAQPQIPTLKYYATDLTKTLDSLQIFEIGVFLEKFEKENSTQMVFLMNDGFDGISEEEFVAKCASQSKLGSGKSNTWILFLVSKDNNRITIATSSDIQEYFSEDVISSIRRNVFLTGMMNGDVYAAVKAGIEAAIRIYLKSLKVVEPEIFEDTNLSKRITRLARILIALLLVLPFFVRRGRGLGTLFFLRAFSGRKRFDDIEFQFTGLKGEIEGQYGKYEGLREIGGPLKFGAKYFFGITVERNWK